MRRLLFLLIVGAGGVAVLLSLGLWQMRRLHWKDGIVAAIETRVAADPVPLDTLAYPDPVADLYRPRTLARRTTGREARVLPARKGEGAGYAATAAFEADDGRRSRLAPGILPDAG